MSPASNKFSLQATDATEADQFEIWSTRFCKGKRNKWSLDWSCKAVSQSKNPTRLLCNCTVSLCIVSGWKDQMYRISWINCTSCIAFCTQNKANRLLLAVSLDETGMEVFWQKCHNFSVCKRILQKKVSQQRTYLWRIKFLRQDIFHFNRTIENREEKETIGGVVQFAS